MYVCIQAPVGMDVGMDQLAMVVTAPRIVTAKIGQSTAAPSSRNVITVTLQTNSPITSASTGAFTITGLQGVEARSGPIALKGDSVSVFKASRDGTPGTGWWYGASKEVRQEEDEEGWGDQGPLSTPPRSLVLMVAGIMLQSKHYVFSFEVLNGNCLGNCPAISLITNGLEFIPASCSSGADASFVQSDVPRSMPVVQAIGAACAGKVYAPLFTTKIISECSTVNANPNTLTVTLRSNVDLVKGATAVYTRMLRLMGATALCSGPPGRKPRACS